jgi:predicted RNA binding protein YcfA (HicA-like mRNA interferase family)
MFLIYIPNTRTRVRYTGVQIRRVDQLWLGMPPYVVSWTGPEYLLSVAKSKKKILEELRQKRRSCSQSEAEAALEAWGFIRGRSKGHAQVWSYKQVTLTLHAPHGGRDMDTGAIAMVIRKIEEAGLMQQAEQEEKRNEEQKDAH